MADSLSLSCAGQLTVSQSTKLLKMDVLDGSPSSGGAVAVRKCLNVRSCEAEVVEEKTEAKDLQKFIDKLKLVLLFLLLSLLLWLFVDRFARSESKLLNQPPHHLLALA